MAANEKGNSAVIAVIVVAVVALAALVAYQQGYLGGSAEEPGDININVPTMSPTPISSPIRTTPPANQY